MAALAVVIMCFGGFVPLLTYVCPMIAMLMVYVVYKLCGRSTALTWYFAVSILAALLSADKEAASIFVVLGYYPIIKSFIEKHRFKWLVKFVFFNCVILALYWFLMNIMGMTQLKEEFRTAGTVLCVIILVLGNVIFYLIDRILGRMDRKFK